MSQLGQLQIPTPVNACSTTVRVRLQLIGATVELKIGSTHVGGGVATWTDQDFDLLPGMIGPGKVISAIQSLSGFTPSSPATVTVGPAPTPTDLTAGQFFKPFYICAQCVWLYGLFPGATVEVLSHSVSLGKAHVRGDGQALVGLSRPLNQDDVLVAFLHACNNTVHTPAGSPINGGAPQRPVPPLAAPTIQPPYQCDQFIQVGGITPGAQVTIARGAGQIGPICVPLATLILGPVPPLKPPPADDALGAHQDFPPDPCKLHGPKAGPVPVQAKLPDAPTVLPPFCEGQTSVSLDNLRPGAMVELRVNGQVFVFGAPAKLTPNITVPALIAMTTVTARQNTCGDPASWGPSSPPTIQVGSTTPVVPQASVPFNHATNVSTKPTLMWNDPASICNAATSFDLELATNTTFTAGVQSFSGITAALHTLTTALPFSTQFFWRVRAHKGAKTTGWSAVFAFTTVAQGAHPTGGGGTGNDADVVRQRCFIEDCCPLFRKVIQETGTYNDAYAKAVAQAGSTCYVQPLEVPCNTKVDPCGP